MAQSFWDLFKRRICKALGKQTFKSLEYGNRGKGAALARAQRTGLQTEMDMMMECQVGCCWNCSSCLCPSGKELVSIFVHSLRPCGRLDLTGKTQNWLIK